MNDFNQGQGYDPKNLQVIFNAFLFAQLIFLGLSLYVVESPEFIYRVNDYLFTAIPLIAIVLDIIANRVFISGFNKLTQEQDLERSMQKLNSIHVLRWGIVESATFMLIFFSMITSNHFFTAFAAANIVYFYTLKPKIFTLNEGF